MDRIIISYAKRFIATGKTDAALHYQLTHLVLVTHASVSKCELTMSWGNMGLYIICVYFNVASINSGDLWAEWE